jgi:hypothetical protein
MRFRRILVRLFFLFIVIGNLAINLPPPGPPPHNLWRSALAWNQRNVIPCFARYFENFNFYHGWAMFAHTPNDTSHDWVNNWYTATVTDAKGIEKKIDFNAPASRPFFSRYVDYREVRYKQNLSAFFNWYLPAFERHFARDYLDLNPNAVFPLRIKVDHVIEPIMAPGFNFNYGRLRSVPVGNRLMTQSQLYCAMPGAN